ncbi:MAG: hypothetical protein K940chlam3_01490, partial [Chlamydiae bacterium]|nr:hypothetical protein [Chlamydiota bacterium]
MESTSELSLFLSSSSSLDISSTSRDVESGLHRYLSVSRIEGKLENRMIEQIVKNKEILQNIFVGPCLGW